MTYLVKPMSYVLVIVLGYVLKRAGFFGKADHRMLSKIMINITLPCTIVQAFASFERDASVYIIAALGFFCALLPLLAMYAFSHGKDKSLRAYRMLNIGGYNIGCFSLPLIEAFFGSAGVVAACVFDVGNAVMMTGGAYAITSTLLGLGDGRRETAKDVAMKFLRSAPFDTYMVMFALAALGVALPQIVFDLTKPAGNANGFLAMLMIGMMFEPAGDRELLLEASRELAARYLFAAVFAAAIMCFAPFDPVVRRTLAVVCFAPLSSLAPIYTDRCGSSTELASFTNSASIAVSLVLMMALSMAFVA